MSFWSGLYIETALFVAFTYVLYRAVIFLGRGLCSEGQKLKIGYILFSLGIALPLTIRFLPQNLMPEAVIEISPPQIFEASAPAVVTSFQVMPATQSLDLTSGHLLDFSILAFCFLAVFLFLKQALALSRYLDQLVCLRKISKTSIKIDNHSIIPFAVQTLSGASIALPLDILKQPQAMMAIVRHEIQHIRQGDSLWVYAVSFFRYLFFWNPFSHLWARVLENQQEFACDEALIGHEKVSVQAYGRYLWEVASCSMASRNIFAGTTNMFLGLNKNVLKRRIEMLPQHRGPSFTKGAFYFFTIVVSSILVATAVFAKGVVSTKTISLERAQELSKTTSQKLKFPIVMDELVLGKLNLFVGTPEGQRFIRASLDRMTAHQSLIERKLSRAGLPPALLAVPIVESGFQNLKGPIGDGFSKPKGKPSTGFNLEGDSIAPGYRGAGLWMFIPETARNYKLKVSDHLDERLNIEKETDAAVSYFSDLYKEFGDWPLAVAAYNHGSKKVHSAIKSGGVKDAWTLAEKKQINEYLSGVAAAMIVMNHPELLN